MSKDIKHFLDLDQLTLTTLRSILACATSVKKNGVGTPLPLIGKTLAMLFEKPSTRTRVSFQVGMQQLGGSVVTLSPQDTQIGRGESIADTARALSRYVDAIMIRTSSPEKLRDLVQFATVPVINGLTDESHPCQIMADIMTFEECKGPIEGSIIAWSGDGNNVATSWVHAAAHFGFELRIACPKNLQPRANIIAWARSKGAKISIGIDPHAAVKDADCIVTDTWVSMGDEAADKHKELAPYQVNEALMVEAKSDAIFMHCLPAHRGEEVTEAVIDGPRSVVWNEAENRLHVQKGVLLWCLE
ncbi:MAG TPA: ornithine carbamoyltransferase [Rhodospirillaceae bacterium]|nr:ornithine carbamoyltransferase [Candidatus Neomarinimicrobiota bacterium]HCX14916.1 ornithine carbamoyltransferase [Rhodospirillaceae bacterium]